MILYHGFIVVIHPEGFSSPPAIPPIQGGFPSSLVEHGKRQRPKEQRKESAGVSVLGCGDIVGVSHMEPAFPFGLPLKPPNSPKSK